MPIGFDELPHLRSGTGPALSIGTEELMSRKWLGTILIMFMFLSLVYKVLKHNAPTAIVADTSVTAFGLELNPFFQKPSEVTESKANSFKKSIVNNFISKNGSPATPGQMSIGGDPLKDQEALKKQALDKQKKDKEAAKKRAAARKRIQEFRKKAYVEYLEALKQKQTDNNTANINTQVSPNTLVGFNQNNADDKEAKDEETLAYWSNLLTSDPSLANLTQFISEFQSGKVSEEVYFQIAQELLYDDRTNVAELGLTALNSSPSAKSFLVITGFMEQADSNNSIRTKANIDLRSNYKSISHLSTISSILNQTTNEFALSMATQILTTMAKENLQATTPDPENPSTPGQVQTASYLTTVEKIKNLIPILERLMESSGDQTVIESAQLAVQEIQKYI